jgi:L-threonylcarbamoyladenylate synthase
VGDTQASAVTELAQAAGFVLTSTTKDLSGKERIVRAVRPGAPRMGAGDLDAAGVATLARSLAAGAIIGVPTDTVYGIAAAWNSPAGVRRLFAAKGRDEERPAAVLFPSVAAVRAALPDLDPRTVRVLESLLPGPYTFVVTTTVERPHLVGTEDSLGVRVPAHPPLLALLAALNIPLVASSANLSGRPDAASADDVDPLLLAHCIAAVDFGEASGAVTGAGEDAVPSGVAATMDVSTTAPSTTAASTVVDLRPLGAGEQAVVLREGAVPTAVVLERIATALGGC